MNPLGVVAPPAVVPGFGLAGASVQSTDDPAAVERRVESLLADGAAVVVVHHTLWRRVPASIRTRWEQRTDRLVLSLPPDDGAPAPDRETGLHELLARAVGYEISFTPGGNS